MPSGSGFREPLAAFGPFYSVPRFCTSVYSGKVVCCDFPCFLEWADPGLNRGPSDFQSLALPAELSAPVDAILREEVGISCRFT